MKTLKFAILLFCFSIATACSSGNDNDGVQVEQEQQLSKPDVASCGACHGAEGISPNTDWPNLAGQQADYLYQQLLLFRDGKRKNELMAAALLEGLTDEQVREIASHYAQMPSKEKSDVNANDLPGAHVRARCVSCHGMTGKTVTGLWPNIAGQQAGYAEKQLLAYKDGTRQHPIMQVIASELTLQQIKDVAEYYATQ